MQTMKNKKDRVLIAPNDISGYYDKLLAGFQEIGISANFANFSALTTSYSSTSSSWVTVRRGQNLLAKAAQHKNPRTIRFRFYTLRTQMYMLLTLIHSLTRIDTYIFVYGRSFLPRNIDLLLLQILGKKVISIIGHGNEARPPYLSYNGVSADSEELVPSLINNMNRATHSMKKKLARIEKYSTYVVGSSCTCQLLTKNFIEMAALRQPISLAAIPIKPVKNDSSITILHSPSDPIVKGSLVFQGIIKAIQDDYPSHDIRYIEISGVSNAKVLEAISLADLVIDQLWSDSPMAMIGYEAASLGTPSLTFGAALSTLEHVDKQIGLPMFGYFSSNDAQEVIQEFIMNKNKRDQLANLQRSFVKEYATPRNVADNFARLIFDDIPISWIVEPNKCTYSGGSGISPELSLKQMSALYENFGIESLHWANAKLVLNEQVEATLDTEQT